jgi:rhamnosyltransferase
VTARDAPVHADRLLRSTGHGGPTPRIGAVVTWFHPDDRAVRTVAAALSQCAEVVVVDNTPDDARASSGAERLPPPAPARWLPLGRNAGLAGALNVGLDALADDLDGVMLLDQDSVLPDGAVVRLAEHLAAAPDVGAVSPAPYDAAEQRYLDPRTAGRPVLAEREVVITSGLLLSRAGRDVALPLREDFFVDAVDLDLCLRLRAEGLRVLQDRSVLLPHELGATRWHGIGRLRVRATHHPTWRLYTGARNGTVLLREHALRRPVWALTQACALAYWLGTVAAFEPPRRHRVAAFTAGLRDGLAGRGDGSGRDRRT